MARHQAWRSCKLATLTLVLMFMQNGSDTHVPVVCQCNDKLLVGILPCAVTLELQEPSFGHATISIVRICTLLIYHSGNLQSFKCLNIMQ